MSNIFSAQCPVKVGGCSFQQAIVTEVLIFLFPFFSCLSLLQTVKLKISFLRGRNY